MEKKDRFKKVAVQRTNKVLKMLELLGNCSNKRNYDYSDEEVNKIFKAIETELKQTKEKFKIEENKNKRFEL